ncbi:hypothetical protein [Hyella patelloides]|uniref:hypothetical protein n=1 Tax=Hyella patelloides TaxID=1982969 RepID=UPI0011A2DC8F|nr:hypothetical protein [Hyella patelloides]
MSKDKLQIPDVPGVSLVAYYREKPLELQKLIVDLQGILQDFFGSDFIPYALKQIHATIIGCEGIRTELGFVNKWFYTLRDEIKYIDYSGFLNYFINNDLFPLDICFGSYQPNVNYQFLSRNQHPGDRSFQLQLSTENTLIPTMIGWSFRKQIITTDINSIRRELQRFNCLHKYHKYPQDIDNDVYLRLGTIAGSYNSDLIASITQTINNYLQTLTPIIIPLSQEKLAIVKYQDLSLPISTTKIYSLADLSSDLNLLQQLYE